MEPIKKSKFALKDDDDEDNDEIGDIINELKTIPRSIPNFTVPKTVKRIIDYSPICWENYFTNKEEILTENQEKIPIYWKGDNGPNILCLHGAGHSALSFAPLAKLFNKYRIMSFDFRSHGYNESQGELSPKTLIDDTIQVLNYINQKYPDENIVIVGHSMGGSVATKTTCEILKNQDKYLEIANKICGLVVIDVVEGTAMEALPFMENIVKSRPQSFDNVENVIEYMYKSQTIKNLESARISVPSLVKKEGKKYIWKTNLLSSQKYWNEWFQGLTKNFLSIKIPKILLLAASDRMDKDLTIAQMQGKFKLSVINNVGHIVHEDDPNETYKLIDDFIKTFRITSLVNDMKPIVGKLGNPNPIFKKYEEN